MIRYIVVFCFVDVNLKCLIFMFLEIFNFLKECYGVGWIGVFFFFGCSFIKELRN